MAERGCGSRVQNALYACVSLSPYGKDIEYFCIDPPRPVDFKPFRTPIIVENGDINNIAVYIGKEFYPFVPDYLEETRVMGISRRIPKNFPIEKLTPGKSRMLMVHERAIPLFEHETGQKCPRNINHDFTVKNTCVFNLWSLSALEQHDKHKVMLIDEHSAEVLTPSVTYTVPVPHKPTPNFEQKKEYRYHMGVFAAFWITHLEYVNKQKKIPTGLKKRVEKSKFDIKVMEE